MVITVHTVFTTVLALPQSLSVDGARLTTTNRQLCVVWQSQEVHSWDLKILYMISLYCSSLAHSFWLRASLLTRNVMTASRARQWQLVLLLFYFAWLTQQCMQLGAGEEEVFHVEMRVILFLIHNYAIRYWVWNAQTEFAMDRQTDGRVKLILEDPRQLNIKKIK